MKRGSSGLSLVVAVNKPTGMTSHDVVNRCRRIFGERRVGHTGTLDPLATGVLPICIGPATRLDRFMTSHDKRYRVTMRFGCETTTDDREGEPTVSGPVMPDLATGEFAQSYIAGLVGEHDQVPPDYSAIKVNGKKAYELARSGKEVNLAARRIEVYESRLVERRAEADGGLSWVIDLSVSKGTYIRALVRDIGRELGCPAHVDALERRTAGALSIEECMSLETIEALKEDAAIDPVRLLGFRFAYVDGFEDRVANGMKLRADELLPMVYGKGEEAGLCPCFGSSAEMSHAPFSDGESISLVAGNRLAALYTYQGDRHCFKPACVFSTPISRG